MPFFSSVLLLCFPLAPLTPWTLQTGSMRVRGQISVCQFPPFISFPSYDVFHHFFLPLPPLYFPCWKAFNLELSSHQLQSVLPYSLYSSTLDISLPPVSSFPPLLLPHLVLSVKLPLPESCVLVPSRCCNLHLQSHSSSVLGLWRCLALWPSCLSDAKALDFIPVDACIAVIVNVTAYGMTENTETTFWALSPQWHIFNVSEYTVCQLFLQCWLESANTKVVLNDIVKVTPEVPAANTWSISKLDHSA